VATRRGVVELSARLDDAVPDGVVFIPFAYVEAAANLLTNPKLDPFGKIPEFKFCAARSSGSSRCARRRNNGSIAYASRASSSAGGMKCPASQ
jgi:predicted molibdopterin-dependent oxidoreductase YjgC